MSLMKTLAKVAIGVAVAKGVGSMMKRGAAQAGGSGSGQTYGGQHSPEPGGFEDRMGEMLGKSARRGQRVAASGRARRVPWTARRRGPRSDRADLGWPPCARPTAARSA